MWRSLWLLQKRLKHTCIPDQMSCEMQLQMHIAIVHSPGLLCTGRDNDEVKHKGTALEGLWSIRHEVLQTQ